MSKISFTYKVMGHAWARAHISDGINELYMSPSYTSDALGDITNAAISLFIMEMPTTIRASWTDEPWEYRWVFEPQGASVLIKILLVRQ